jgi:hypothetical protein
MSGSVFFEGNAYIDGGKIINTHLTSSSVSNCQITTSSLDMNLSNITSVKDPILTQDAATKKYVDDLGIVITRTTLNGTNPSVVSDNLRGSYVISVTNEIINGPSAVFHVTKNSNSNQAHIVRTVASPGNNSSNFLSATWPPNTGILLQKTGSTYDGSYRVKIM